MSTSLDQVLTDAKDNDPEELKRRIRDLERQLRAKPAAAVAPKAEQVRVEIPVFKNGEVGRLETVTGQLATIGAQLVEAGESLRAAAGEISGALRTVVSRPAPAMPRPQITTVRAAPVARPTIAPRREVVRQVAESTGDATLKAGERKMLQALAQRHPLKYTRMQLGTMSKFASRSGTFRNYFGNLKRVGFVVEQDGEIAITDSGLQYVGSDIEETPTTTDELLQMWRARLRAGAAVMLDALVAIYPNGMTRAELGEVSGFHGGTFRNYLGKLRSNGLVKVQSDLVTASDTLFVE